MSEEKYVIIDSKKLIETITSSMRIINRFNLYNTNITHLISFYLTLKINEVLYESFLYTYINLIYYSCLLFYFIYICTKMNFCQYVCP